METNSAWASATNVLCVRLDTLGDVLMTTSAIRALKESCSGRRITLLTSSSGAQVAALVPDIDRVIEYEAPWLKATAERRDSQAEYQMADFLHRQNFDAAVIFTVYTQSPLPAAFLCYLAGIPLRLAHCHENPYQLLTDWVPDPEPQVHVRHEVQRQLDLVGAIGCQASDPRLSLKVPSAAVATLRRKLAALQIPDGRPWILVHPGATAASRRYAPESFAAVIRSLALDYGLSIILTGSASEVPLIEGIRLAAGVPTATLAGELDLGELAALIAGAPLLIANNTGPVHMAAALGTPVVDLYALTNPQHTPWAVPHRLLYHDVSCKFCYKSICPQGHHDCLRLIAPEQVVAAAVSLLTETGHAPCPAPNREPAVYDLGDSPGNGAPFAHDLPAGRADQGRQALIADGRARP